MCILHSHLQQWAVCSFPSKQFYGGMLQPHSSIDKAAIRGLKKFWKNHMLTHVECAMKWVYLSLHGECSHDIMPPCTYVYPCTHTDIQTHEHTKQVHIHFLQVQAYTTIPWFVQLNSQLSFVMLMVMKMVTLEHRNLVKTLGVTGMKQHKWWVRMRG